MSKFRPDVLNSTILSINHKVSARGKDKLVLHGIYEALDSIIILAFTRQGLKHSPFSLEQLQTQVRLFQTSSSNLQPVLEVFHERQNDLRYRAEIEKPYYAP